MKRTIKPENLVQIKKQDIHLELLEGDEFLKVRVLIKNFGRCKSGEVFLEAYHRNGFERISLGEIENYEKEEKEFSLSRSFPNQLRPKINFIIKIVCPETYQILGYAERLKEAKYANSLLKLNDENEEIKNIFKIDFENPDEPIFFINPKLKPSAEKLKPIIAEMALKEILTYLLNNEENVDFENHKWGSFASNISDEKFDESWEKEKKEEWIQNVLCKFCEKYKIPEKINQLFDSK